jgi:hypothetical protein
MSLIVVDVEADGPIPGPDEYSMILLGAVIVEEGLSKRFSGRLRPISPKWIPEALAVSGFTREETLKFDDPAIIMTDFSNWVLHSNTKGHPTFISDNNGFDWMFVCHYLWHFTGGNPFGFSSRRIGDLYSGMNRDLRFNTKWKKLRKTKHTHSPVDDAVGNAEALLEMERMGLKGVAD